MDLACCISVDYQPHRFAIYRSVCVNVFGPERLKLAFCVGSRHANVFFSLQILEATDAEQAVIFCTTKVNGSKSVERPFSTIAALRQLFDQRFAVLLLPVLCGMRGSICVSVMIFSEAALLRLSDCSFPTL